MFPSKKPKEKINETDKCLTLRRCLKGCLESSEWSFDSQTEQLLLEAIKKIPEKWPHEASFYSKVDEDTGVIVVTDPGSIWIAPILVSWDQVVLKTETATLEGYTKDLLGLELKGIELQKPYQKNIDQLLGEHKAIRQAVFFPTSIEGNNRGTQWKSADSDECIIKQLLSWLQYFRMQGKKFSTKCFIPIIIITTPSDTDISAHVYQSVVRKYLGVFAEAVNVRKYAPLPNVPNKIVKLRLPKGNSSGGTSGHLANHENPTFEISIATTKDSTVPLTDPRPTAGDSDVESLEISLPVDIDPPEISSPTPTDPLGTPSPTRENDDASSDHPADSLGYAGSRAKEATPVGTTIKRSKDFNSDEDDERIPPRKAQRSRCF
ncbi:hypothetical protein TWF173_000858 [Orbilia oligospora]|nr:hypothetical protein TWF173_000858 [Orbilia oligospora]